MSLVTLGTVQPETGRPPQKVGFFITTATTTTLVAAVAGQRITVFGLWLFNASLANSLTLQDGAGTNLIAANAVVALPSNFVLVFDLRGDAWFVPTGIGQSLQIITSSAGPLVGYLYFTQG